MTRQPVLCNGQKTGRSCVHYWAHVEKVESANADYIRLGQTWRVCGWHPSIANEMSADQLAVRCNQYTPRWLPLWKRPLALLRIVDDPGTYQSEYEEYRPLTPEQIKALQDDGPSLSEHVAEQVASLEREALRPMKKPEVSLDDAVDDLAEGDGGIFS